RQPDEDEPAEEAFDTRTVGINGSRQDDAPEVVTRRPDAAPAVGGGPEARARAAATKNSRLSGQQQRILDAAVKHRGDRQAAALEVGVSASNVNVTLHAIGAKGLLPIEL